MWVPKVSRQEAPSREGVRGSQPGRERGAAEWASQTEAPLPVSKREEKTKTATPQGRTKKALKIPKEKTQERKGTNEWWNNSENKRRKEDKEEKKKNKKQKRRLKKQEKKDGKKKEEEGEDQ